MGTSTAHSIARRLPLLAALSLALMLVLESSPASAQIRWAKVFPSAGTEARGLDAALTHFGWIGVLGRSGYNEPRRWFAHIADDGEEVWHLDGQFDRWMLAPGGLDYLCGWSNDTVQLTQLSDSQFFDPVPVHARTMEYPVAAVETRDTAVAIVLASGLALHDVRKVTVDGATVWRRSVGQYVGTRTSFVVDASSLVDNGVAGVWEFGRVFRLSASGDSLWDVVSGVRVATCICGLSDGTILVGGLDSVGGCVVRLDSSGRELSRWHPMYDTASIGPQRITGDTNEVVVLGHVGMRGVSKPVLTGGDENGTLRWRMLLDVSERPVFMSAVTELIDGYVLTGYRGLDPETELMVIRIDVPPAGVDGSVVPTVLDLR